MQNQLRLCLLDLDDTLIPTTWYRKKIDEFRRIGSGSEFNTDLLLRLAAKELNDTLGCCFDELLCATLSALNDLYDSMVIVTNARSKSWVKNVFTVFPRFAQLLKAKSICLVKTEPNLDEEPNAYHRPSSYINFWAASKQREFEKFLGSVEAQLRAALLGDRSADPNAEPSLHFDLTCIGDNIFEHLAFINTTVKLRSSSVNRVIRCSCGLAPKQFCAQLLEVRNVVQAMFGQRPRELPSFSAAPIAAERDASLLRDFVELATPVSDRVRYAAWAFPRLKSASASVHFATHARNARKVSI